MVETLYKLTRRDRTTYQNYVWPVGEWQTFSGEGPACSRGWSHWYTSPGLALLLNPIHGGFPVNNLTLWRGEGLIGLRNNGLKVMCARARILVPIPLPVITLEQRITFGVQTVRTVYTKSWYVAWATAWLTGRDRSKAAAEAAEEAVARAAEETAARAAEETAARAAEAAGWATKAAAVAAEAAAAEEAAGWATKAAAWAAAAAVEAAAWAAKAAAELEKKGRTELDLISLADAALAPWTGREGEEHESE